MRSASTRPGVKRPLQRAMEPKYWLDKNTREEKANWIRLNSIGLNFLAEKFDLFLYGAILL